MAVDDVVNQMVQLLQPQAMASAKQHLESEFKFDEAKDDIKAGGEKEMGPVVERAAIFLADSLYYSLRDSISFSLEPNLFHHLNETVSQRSREALSQPTAHTIIAALAPALNRLILKPVHNTTTRLLLHQLTTVLTPSISLAVSRAITRGSHKDYYCYYCAKV
eukprot:538795-Amorphochlora_amoeboformis.AAC.1